MKRRHKNVNGQETAQPLRVAFIVKGPPTYMNAEEAQHQAGLNAAECSLFVVLPSIKAFSREERMNTVIDRQRWHSVHWITSQTKNKYRVDANGNCQVIKQTIAGVFLAHCMDAIKIRWLAARYGRFDIVYTVHNSFHEYLAYSFKPKKLTLIEAGLSTIQRIQQSGYINYKERAQGSLKWIYRLTGFRVFDRKATALFTGFEGELRTRHAMIHNENQLKREHCAGLPVSDYVLWIGTPICEIHGFSTAFYYDLIAKGLVRAGCAGSPVTYIPHPGKEESSKLEEVRSRLGCEIDDRLLPVEIKVAKAEALPRAVLTPFSSSLMNLEKILPKEVELLSIWHPSYRRIPGLVNWRDETSRSGSRIRFVDISHGDETEELR